MRARIKELLGYYHQTRTRLIGIPEEDIEPIYTEISLDRTSKRTEVEGFRRIYSEMFIKLDQRKRDVRTLLYETTTLPIKDLDLVFYRWPELMYSEYKRQSK